MMKRKNRRRGFTLAELIMAVALLAVFSVFIVQMFAKADQLARKARILDQSVACAANYADQWKMEGDQGVPQAILNLRHDLKAGKTGSITLDIHFQECAANDAMYVVAMTLQPSAQSAADTHLWQLTLVVGHAKASDSKPLYTLTACQYFPEEVAAR